MRNPATRLAARLSSCAILGLLGCGPTSPAEVGVFAPAVVADVGQRSRPFRATIDFGETRPDAPARCNGGPGFTAVRGGEARHLGKVVVYESGCTDLSSIPPMVKLGEAAFEAANGDVVHLAFSASLGAGGSVAGAFDIVGGTGRFSGASGSGTVTNENVPGHLPFYYEGWITY